MSKREKRKRDWWAEFLRGIREDVDQGDNDGNGDGYDPFLYAPGPPFRKGAHPGHVRGIMRWFGRGRRR